MGDLGATASSILNYNAVTDTNETNRKIAEQNREETIRANKANEEIAKNNLAQQQKEFEYQQQLNQTTMQREDTAIQRQAEDYQKAGFNRLLAAEGGGASSSALTTYTSAGDNRQVQPAKLDYQAIAPMLQMGDFIGGIMNFAMDIKERQAQLNKTNEETKYIKGQILGQDIENDINIVNKMIKNVELEEAPYKKAQIISDWLKSELDRKQKIIDYELYNDIGIPSNSGYPQEMKLMKSLIHTLESGDIEKINKLIPDITNLLKDMAGNAVSSTLEAGSSLIGDFVRNIPKKGGAILKNLFGGK